MRMLVLFRPPPFWHGLLVVLWGWFGVNSLQAEPTAEQQYFLELVNRLRMAPYPELEHLVNLTSPATWDQPKSDHPTVAAALDWFGVSAGALSSQWNNLTAAPPLAWNDSLSVSAAAYSNVMVQSDTQAHGLTGQSLAQLFTAAGYSSQWGDLAQNLFATATDSDHAHAALAIDWGPDGGNGTGIQSGATHRAALMDPLFKEIGIGFQTVSIPFSNTEVTGAQVVTQHLANQQRSNGVNLVADAILTGVIYQDSVLADQFYTPGEGQGGMLVFVYDNASGALLASGQTGAAGGFNITLTDFVEGVVYRVEAPASGQAAKTFSLNAWTEDYGSPGSPDLVTFYDNVYAAFVVVPEPSSALFLLLTGLMGACRRRR